MWLCLLGLATALQMGSVKQNTMLPFPVTVDSTVVATQVSLDSNWRWIHTAEGYTNCFAGNDWVADLCPNAQQCSQTCVIDGVPEEDWKTPYGVTVPQPGTLRMQYVTEGLYGPNVGSRVYIVGEKGDRYQGFDLRGKRFSFTIDISRLPCGLNAALYTVEMPLANPYDADLDASFGVNYGDAQCPSGIKYVEGQANLDKKGACSNEYDIWEGNSRSQAIALHPCSVKGVDGCTNTKDCGNGKYRYEGVCDKNGADWNPNRHGWSDLYGAGTEFQVDSSKPFRVHTDFPVDPSSGLITGVERWYEQSGQLIWGGSMNASSIRKQTQSFDEENHFEALGGFQTMSESYGRQHVVVLSIWDDEAVQMRWLDSVYPAGSTKPGAYRGPCSSENNSPSYLRKTFPKAYVEWSDVEVSKLDGTTPSPEPTPEPLAECSGPYGQCSGKTWNGPTCCQDGWTCESTNDWYGQCVPDSSSVTTPTPNRTKNVWVCLQCALQ
jgi:cellulose 1,4-beta-cellobiosidase